MQLHTNLLLVVMAVCFAAVMTIQNRAMAIKFDAYLSQEKSLNAQLEADLKHITQSANQVTESGNYHRWKQPEN